RSPVHNRSWTKEARLTPLALRRFLFLRRPFGFLACLLGLRLFPSRSLLGPLRRLRWPCGRRAGRSRRSRLAFLLVRLFLDRNLFYLDRTAPGPLGFFFFFESGQLVVFLVMRLRIEHGTSVDASQDCRTALDSFAHINGVSELCQGATENIAC